MSDHDTDELDRAAMASLASGRDAALNELIERHGPRIFHYVLRSLNDEEEAADIAQETFFRVYQNRGKFRSDARFTPWLYMIATNLLRDRLRRMMRHPEVSLQGLEEMSGPGVVERSVPATPSPDEDAISNERAEAVRNAVQALPEDLRTPLILAEYENRSHAEIGTMLNCSAKAVEMRIYRARHQLRAALQTILQMA
jgi:RNA polymerase sigma-70 factor, ECF subfamily